MWYNLGLDVLVGSILAYGASSSLQWFTKTKSLKGGRTKANKKGHVV
jgi:hypothetical protein